MPRLEELSQRQRQSVLMFPCLEHDEAPFTPLKRELSQSKVGLVTSAGLHMRGDKPFEQGDPSYRVIPSSAQAKDILQSQTSIGFDHTAFYKDMNVTFPMDRLSELAERKVVGSLAENYYSFMGAQRDPRKIIEVSAPEVAQRLVAEGVEVVLLTPT